MQIDKVIIDNMVVAGDDAGGFSNRVNDSTFSYIEKVTPTSYPYRKAFHCEDGSFIQWTNETGYKPIRFDFNPSKCDSEGAEKIITTMKYPKLNRTDIALDVKGVDLSRYQIIDRSGRKRNSWHDGTLKLETQYIGAPQSDLRIRLYNKAKEQGVEGDWWRIEAQMRGKWVDSINGEYRDERNQVFNLSPFLMDPFEGITLKVPELSTISNIKERAMIHYLITYPEHWNELTRPTRLKYKKILTSMGASEEIELSKLFATKSNDIMYDIQKWLRLAKRNNVIK